MGQQATRPCVRSARPRDLGPGGLPAVRAALLRRYQGLGTTLGLRTVQVRTGQQIPSAIGREEYVRVRLEEPPDGGLPLALPVYGKSGLLGPLIRGPRPPARGPRQRGVGLRDRSHGAALPHPLLRIRRMPTVI